MSHIFIFYNQIRTEAQQGSADQRQYAVLAQACVNWPIRADWLNIEEKKTKKGLGLPDN